MKNPKKIIIIWAVFFILSFLFCSFFKDEIITLETDPLDLKPYETIGVYNTKTKHFLKKSGWITGINFEVVGASNLQLHHIVVANMARQDWTCPDMFPQRLHATAKEMTPLDFPNGYGYFIDKRERLASYVHLYNPTPNTYKNVTVKIKISLLPFNFFKRLKNTQPIWLDIKNCTWDATYFIPPKTTQTFRLEQPYRIPFDSKLVYAFGHVHNFSKGVNLLLNSQSLIEFKPLPHPENIEKIKFFQSSNGPVLKEGNVLDLITEYNNTTSGQIDAMGESLIYIRKYK